MTEWYLTFSDLKYSFRFSFFFRADNTVCSFKFKFHFQFLVRKICRKFDIKQNHFGQAYLFEENGEIYRSSECRILRFSLIVLIDSMWWFQNLFLDQLFDFNAKVYLRKWGTKVLAVQCFHLHKIVGILYYSFYRLNFCGMV